jgi:hypothetical protein
LPALPPMRRGWSRSAHISLDSALGDADTELQKFTADSLRSPEPILERYAPNERIDVRGEARLARPSSSGPPSPPESESVAVPAKQSLGLHQEQGDAPQGTNLASRTSSPRSHPRKTGHLTVRDTTMGCCRSNAFSAMSAAICSEREQTVSAVKPASRGKGRLARRNTARDALALRQATEQRRWTRPFNTSPMWPIGDDGSSLCSIREAGQ